MVLIGEKFVYRWVRRQTVVLVIVDLDVMAAPTVEGMFIFNRFIFFASFFVALRNLFNYMVLEKKQKRGDVNAAYAAG